MSDDFIEATVSNADAIKWENKGQETLGILKEIRTNVGSNASNLYIFSGAKGDFAVWGSALLDSRLSDKLGKEVKIKYNGKKRNPKTNREYNDFSVFYRETPMIEDRPAL